MTAPPQTWQAEDHLLIRAPAERVFEALRDYNRAGSVFGLGRLPWGYATRILGGEPQVVEGSVVAHRLLTLRFRRRIERIEPNRKIVESYIGPNDEGTGIWQLEERPDGVLLTYLYDAADTGWRSRLIYRLAGSEAHHHFYSHALRRLKRRLEAERR